MDYKIYPLAMTMVDWKLYSDQVKQILNIDPLKGLGASYIDRESPAAYLATLDLENQPLKQLREGCLNNPSFRHVSVSFIGSMGSELFFELICSFPDIYTLSKEASRTSHFIILTADMSIWHHSIRSALSQHSKSSTELKRFFHLLLIHMEQMGFKEVWSKYERKISPNGTLTFV